MKINNDFSKNFPQTNKQSSPKNSDRTTLVQNGKVRGNDSLELTNDIVGTNAIETIKNPLPDKNYAEDLMKSLKMSIHENPMDAKQAQSNHTHHAVLRLLR